jgi:hypothetical protein
LADGREQSCIRERLQFANYVEGLGTDGRSGIAEELHHRRDRTTGIELGQGTQNSAADFKVGVT